MSSHKPWIFGALLLSLTVSGPQPGLCSVPDTITLNQNGKLYEPFKFNHARHIDAIRECSDCHHHTTGTLVLNADCARCHRNSSPTAVVSCKGCHSATPFSPQALKEKREAKQRFHLDTPGIKGAMHRSCIGCHSKKGAGPVGCQECHPRTKEGDALYRSGKFAPKPSLDREKE